MNPLAYQNRADQCIAQGALTNSKRPECFVKGVYPTHLTMGKGCHVWDTSGKKYVDFICGLGSNLIGYANDSVTQAVVHQLHYGATLSLSSVLEIEVAEQLKSAFPFIDLVKFLKTGSEACSAAIKIARAKQGVTFGSQRLHEMWRNEVLRRLPQERELSGRSSPGMQNVHQDLSVLTPCYGNKEAGSKKIHQNGAGQSDREASFPETTDQDQSPWQGQDILCSQEGQKGWEARQAFVQDMWRLESQRASQGLSSTARRDVAVSLSSRLGAPRWLILSEGYHGHHDAFSSLTTPGCGVPSDPGILPLKDNEDLLPIAAAVIVEPIMTDTSIERIAWLQKLRDDCTKHGVVLIFDEVITGFRFPRLSVSNYYGIIPDLICLGKALGGGLPLSVVGGRKDIMNCGEYFVSSTFAGEGLSLAAAKVVLTDLQRNRYDMQDLWNKGQEFLDEFNALWPEKIRIEGYPTRGAFKGDELTKALFWQECCRAGILFGASWFFNFPLAKEMFTVMGTIKDVITRLKTGSVRLEGEMPKSPFAAKVRAQ